MSIGTVYSLNGYEGLNGQYKCEQIMGTEAVFKRTELRDGVCETVVLDLNELKAWAEKQVQQLVERKENKQDV